MAELYKRPTLIGNIQKIAFLPCHLNGAAFVVLSTRAFIKQGISFLEPDPKEIYHLVTNEPLIHSIRQGVADLVEGTALEDSEVIRFMGQLAGIYDRAVWWIFIASLFADGLMDFTSNYIRMDPCLSGRGAHSGTNWISAINDKGDPNGADWLFPDGFVRPSSVILNESNGWRGTIACNAKWGLLTGKAVGVTGEIRFTPDDGTPHVTIDKFSNANPDGSRNQEFHVLYGHYQGVPGRNGVLHAQWSYSGQPLPSGEAFLLDGSTAYVSF